MLGAAERMFSHGSTSPSLVLSLTIPKEMLELHPYRSRGRGQTLLLRSCRLKTLQSLLGTLTGNVTSISFCPADQGYIFNTMNVNKPVCKIASRKMLLLTEKPADPVFPTVFLGSQICVLLWDLLAEMTPLASAQPV